MSTDSQLRMARRTTAFGTLTILALAVGCGASADRPHETPGVEGQALQADADSYVAIRRDLRRCAAPLCGGYWVRALNGNGPEEYVSRLEYASSGLSDEDVNALEAASPASRILRGHLGPAEPRFGTRPLLVREAFRGMPGVKVAEGDVYFTVSAREPPIECFVAPCPNEIASPVNAPVGSEFDRLSVDAAAQPFVAKDWLAARVTAHGAIAAGHFEEGALFPGGREQVLVASQVFLRIPDTLDACPRFRLVECPQGTVRTFRRDANRCQWPTECVRPGLCELVIPVCAEGYTLRSWRAEPHACPAWACDPTFVAGD